MKIPNPFFALEFRQRNNDCMVIIIPSLGGIVIPKKKIEFHTLINIFYPIKTSKSESILVKIISIPFHFILLSQPNK